MNIFVYVIFGFLMAVVSALPVRNGGTENASGVGVSKGAC